jgi:aminoglycoside 6'-N-acetyltransferase I
MIYRCDFHDHAGWLGLREALWTHCSREDHLADMARIASMPDRFVTFLAGDSLDEPIGFAEVSLRSDYVNGTSSSPVAFLEGLFVAPSHRRHGVARELVQAAQEWARSLGCFELASDAGLENTLGQALHRALGFEETERVVYFRKVLQ